jgi:RNA polymerase sigma-70 factor, ECF subfamily
MSADVIPLSQKSRNAAPPASEGEAVTRAQGGDLDAFSWLLAQHAPRVLAFLRRWTRSAALANDVFQEASIRAFRGLHRLRRGAPFRPWFYAIAVNRAKTRRADDDRRRERDTELRAHTADRVEAGSLALEARQVLDAALAMLSASDRELLLLRFAEELTIEEVAQVLGAPGFVVKMRLSRARKRFREAVRKLEER